MIAFLIALSWSIPLIIIFMIVGDSNSTNNSSSDDLSKSGKIGCISWLLVIPILCTQLCGSCDRSFDSENMREWYYAWFGRYPEYSVFSSDFWYYVTSPVAIVISLSLLVALSIYNFNKGKELEKKLKEKSKPQSTPKQRKSKKTNNL